MRNGLILAFGIVLVAITNSTLVDFDCKSNKRAKRGVIANVFIVGLGLILVSIARSGIADDFEGGEMGN
ncbi:hypothetical protein [Bradyrhizobium shewense]|uniref:hypothetical protein n=1 Tax=Bradyrhizobium shewense TaxID=1761772 RepID=UPI00101AD7E7|nr:hypothetical protein [Bradyrhizobium shewense]